MVMSMERACKTNQDGLQTLNIQPYIGGDRCDGAKVPQVPGNAAILDILHTWFSSFENHKKSRAFCCKKFHHVKQANAATTETAIDALTQHWQLKQNNLPWQVNSHLLGWGTQSRHEAPFLPWPPWHLILQGYAGLVTETEGWSEEKRRWREGGGGGVGVGGGGGGGGEKCDWLWWWHLPGKWEELAFSLQASRPLPCDTRRRMRFTW